MDHIDQRRFDNQRVRRPVRPAHADDGETIDAREAAAILDIKLPTLYAYASRGLLKSITSRDPGKRRQHHYLREEVNRLKARHDARKGHTAVAASALRWGEPVLESRISTIDHGGPIYRGTPALDLMDRSVEEVAELLWVGELPDHRPRWPTSSSSGGAQAISARQLARVVPLGSAAPALLSAVLSWAALRDPERTAAGADEELDRARRLMRLMTASLALAQDPARFDQSLAQPSLISGLCVSLGLETKRRTERLLNRTLVLCADHELNASTFTARVCASSGADLYACLLAAISTHSGPRHGGSCDRIEALLDESPGPAEAERMVRARVRRGEALPSFGHPLYPRGDPRTQPILELVRAMPANDRLAKLLAVVDAVEESHRERPSVDWALVACAVALNLPKGTAVGLFALGRAAGWIAHSLEQRHEGFLLRPRARYVGRPRVTPPNPTNRLG